MTKIKCFEIKEREKRKKRNQVGEIALNRQISKYIDLNLNLKIFLI